MGDTNVLAVLAVVLYLVVRSMIKDHKRDGGCSGDCSCCSRGCANQSEEV